ncbi:methionine aminopeptidase 1D, mitochondrial-like [Mytilus edulis]|uniref:Methionine aminopeptidase n=1 Tax=Mytilus edulis TaxID=6550 RepID=A0A8S3PVJ3_MYTED|nr:map [Mytilus edulis]
MIKKLSYSVYRSLRTRFDISSAYNAAVTKALDRKFSLVLPQETTPFRTIPSYIQKPPYAVTGHVAPKKIGEDVEVKNKHQIKGMRKAGKIARKILNQTAECLKIGITTDEIDAKVHQLCIENDVYPSPLNYKHFPKSVCTSINNVACHGIPDLRPLGDGDIINVDITVFCDGFHGDLSETYLIGNVDEKGRKLVHATELARDAAISVCKPGVEYCQIGKTISSVAEAHGFSVVPAFIGHGIGERFHCPPDIFHFAYESPEVMTEGVTFTIEPILSEGNDEVEILSDGWTAVMCDGSRTAQFEHTVLVTKDGVEILTE